MIDNLSEPLKSQVNSFLNGGNGHNGNGKKSNPLEVNFTYNVSFYSGNTAIDRALDITGGFLGLVILLPLFIITSLVILITQGRPLFFKQSRLGKNGEEFTVYKFRTMRADAEEILKEDEELYRQYVENDYKLKAKDDPRITGIGSFLRRSSIDELPQFFNVLKGDMSLVGPRPIVPKEIERYGEHAKEFLSVKPGITGLWQVTGRSEIGYPDRKYLDLIYIDRKNLWLDIKILIKTVFVVFKKVGAH